MPNRKRKNKKIKNIEPNYGSKAIVMAEFGTGFFKIRIKNEKSPEKEKFRLKGALRIPGHRSQELNVKTGRIVKVDKSANRIIYIYPINETFEENEEENNNHKEDIFVFENI